MTAYGWMIDMWVRKDFQGVDPDTLCRMSLLNGRHTLPNQPFEINHVVPTTAIQYTFSVVEHTGSILNVTIPATWILGFTKDKHWEKKVIKSGTVVHVRPSCCNMTDPKPLLVHACFANKINWCMHCAAASGAVVRIS